jgi:hypothetical protein
MYITAIEVCVLDTWDRIMNVNISKPMSDHDKRGVDPVFNVFHSNPQPKHGTISKTLHTNV